MEPFQQEARAVSVVAETEHRYPPGSQVFEDIPLDEEIDWRTIDRLIVLMSLTVTLRLLRKRRPSMSERVRHLIMKRMRTLIEAYKKPRSRR